MYQSIPSLTIHPGDPRGFAHSSCLWGRIFAHLSCPGVFPGVLNQSKSSIILKKARFSLCLLNKWVAAFSYVYICQKWAVWLRPHLHYNKYAAYQNLSRWIEIHPGRNFTRSRTFTWQTCQRKPNSIHVSYHWEFIRTPLFTGVQIESVFRFVQLGCKFTWVNALTPWHKQVGAYLGNYLSTFSWY